MPTPTPHDIGWFASPAELRDWLEANHETATERWVGMRPKAAGLPDGDLGAGRRRGPVRRLDRRRPVPGRRRLVHPDHAPAAGLRVERAERRPGRGAPRRGPDAPGRRGGVRRAAARTARRSTRSSRTGALDAEAVGGAPGRRRPRRSSRRSPRATAGSWPPGSAARSGRRPARSASPPSSRPAPRASGSPRSPRRPAARAAGKSSLLPRNGTAPRDHGGPAAG